MTKKINEETRTIMAPFVYDALKTAWEGHKRFTIYKPLMNAEDFKKYQDACKASISCIILIIKLIEMLGVEPDRHSREDLKLLIDASRVRIEEYNQRKCVQQEKVGQK